MYEVIGKITVSLLIILLTLILKWVYVFIVLFCLNKEDGWILIHLLGIITGIILSIIIIWI